MDSGTCVLLQLGRSLDLGQHDVLDEVQHGGVQVGFGAAGAQNGNVTLPLSARRTSNRPLFSTP